jgi:hypothetical protein
LPQVLPVIASQVLYYIESNTRSSTIIGIVGAGGIGLYLAETIRTLEWQQVSFLILLVLAGGLGDRLPLRQAALRDHRHGRPCGEAGVGVTSQKPRRRCREAVILGCESEAKTRESLASEEAPFRSAPS